MPKIPSYEGLQVQEAPTPTPKISTDIPSIEAFGGGKSLQAFDTLDKILLQAKKEADETFVKEAQNKATILRNQLLFDEKDGILNKSGKDVFNASNDYNDRFDKEIQNIEKDLSEEQKAAFQNSLLDIKEKFRIEVERHVSTEREAFNKATFQTSIKLNREDAINNSFDELAIKKSIEQQHADLDKLAQYDAKTQGSLDLLKLEASSDTYKNVLLKRIDNFSEFGGVEETKKLFNSIQDQMTEDDKASIRNHLEKASSKHEGLIASDKIFEKYKFNQAKAFDELRKIKDDDTRLAARQYLGQAFNDLEGAQRADRENTFRFVYNKLDEAKGDIKILDKYASSIRNLNPSDQQALVKYAEAVRNDNLKNQVTDPRVFNELEKMTPDELKKVDLLEPKVFNNLSKSHFEYFTKKQTGGLTGKEFKLSQQTLKAIDSIYAEAGLKIPKKNDSPSRIEKYNSYNEQIKQQVMQSGDNSEANVINIARNLVKKEVLNQRPFFSREEYRFYAKPEDVDLTDIKPEILRDITNSLNKKGKAINEQNIKDLYIKALKLGRI
jgi:hypothetical protein